MRWLNIKATSRPNIAFDGSVAHLVRNGIDQKESDERAKHIRAVQPFDGETGGHWHDMTTHFVYVLRGWIEVRFDRISESVTVVAGSCLS